MLIDTNSLVSITEANQNFSKVAKLVDEKGSVVILKNNVPRYLIIDFNKAEDLSEVSDDKVSEISKKLINQNLEAYKVLAQWNLLSLFPYLFSSKTVLHDNFPKAIIKQ